MGAWACHRRRARSARLRAGEVLLAACGLGASRTPPHRTSSCVVPPPDASAAGAQWAASLIAELEAKHDVSVWCPTEQHKLLSVVHRCAKAFGASAGTYARRAPRAVEAEQGKGGPEQRVLARPAAAIDRVCGRWIARGGWARLQGQQRPPRRALGNSTLARQRAAGAGRDQRGPGRQHGRQQLARAHRARHSRCVREVVYGSRRQVLPPPPGGKSRAAATGNPRKSWT